MFWNVTRGCVLALITAVSIPLGASGQSPETVFEELPAVLFEGDRVRVIETGGASLEGRIVDVTPQTVILRSGGNQTRSLSSVSIAEIRRRSPDKWWNGLLIGAGAGAALGLLVDVAEGDPCEEPGASFACIDFSPLFVPVFSVVGTAVGGLTDLFISRYDTVYQNPSATRTQRLIIAPVVSADAAALRLEFSF